MTPSVISGRRLTRPAGLRPPPTEPLRRALGISDAGHDGLGLIVEIATCLRIDVRSAVKEMVTRVHLAIADALNDQHDNRGVDGHGLLGVGKANEVGTGERSADLLHLAAGDQIAEVDGEEARVLEECADLGLRIEVVA